MKNLSYPQNARKFFLRFNMVFLKVCWALWLALISPLSNVYAQAPNISYASPQVYNPFVPKAPLTPRNTGGAIPGTTPVTLGNLAVDITAMAVDTSGNIYIVGNNSTGVTKLTGNTFVTLGSTLLHPTGVAVDAAGNIFIADKGHSAIKEIPAGSKSEVIYVGAVHDGSSPGSPILGPYGIAVDAADNLFVSTGQGVFELPAGARNSVYIGGIGDKGVAVDAAGNVYACDTNLEEVIEILASTGETITLGGNLPGLDGIAVDSKGNVYYSQDDAVIAEIPTGGGSPFYVATGLSDATSVAIDKKGNIFTESGGSSVDEAPLGIYTITPALPPGLSLDRKTGIITGTPVAITPVANYSVTGANASGSSTTTINIAVSAAANPNISYSTPQTFYVGKLGSVSSFNTGGAVPAQQPVTLLASGLVNQQVRGLTVDAAGNIYAALYNDAIIKKIPPGGGTAINIGSGFGNPTAVAVDGAGNVFVADNLNHVVKEILASNGSTVTYASGFTYPQGVVLDAAGNLYVTDNSKNALYKVPAGGGSPIELTTGLNGPTGVAVDAAGNIYVANTKGNNIRELPAGGTTTIVFATGFNAPYDLAVDAAGNVFVADQGNDAVKRIPAGGGTPVAIAQAIPFKQPGAVALDASGNIYVEDWTNQAVYEINPSYFINPTLPSGLSIDQSTGTISGTPTAVKPAANYTVTGYNSGGTGTAVVNIKIVSASNTVLSGLTASRGVLSPAFNTSTTAYNISVANTAPSISFTPTTTGAAVVTINGTTVASGTASPLIPLLVGANNIHVVVDSGTTEANYTVTVNRATSANANLSSFKLSKGNITPGFSGTTYNYNVTVANTVTSITVTATAAGAGATITVNGTAVTSGTASAPIGLNFGNTTISIVVTASDGTTTQTYTLTVNRPGATNANLSAFKISRGVLTPAFSPSTTSYTASVVNGVSSITVSPTTSDPNATVTVNGKLITPGTAADTIALAVGPNTITTIVTAQDGVTTKTYTLTETRAAGNADSFIPGISVQTPTDAPPLNEDIISVHQGISPNGDGVNDFLVIDGIQAFPNNKLSIMNRNGQLIYEASGYDNSSKVFDGHSNKNGQMQLPGTYFYQLDYTVKGITRHKTGFIVLKY